MTGRAVAAFAALAVLSAVCTPGQTNQPSTARPKDGRVTAGCADLNPVLNFLPSPASTSNLAIIKLHGTPGFVIADVADPLHPRRIQTYAEGSRPFEAGTIPQFANADEIAYFFGGAYIRESMLGYAPTVVARPCTNPYTFDISSDGTVMAYVTSDSKYSYLHLVRNFEDRIVSAMPPEPQAHEPACVARLCGVLFSPNGDFIASVEWPGRPLRIWTAEGKALKVADASQAQQPAWSGGSLFWRDARGVERWQNGTQSLFLSGVNWTHPSASPAGKQIVYGVQDSAGVAHVQVVDLETATATEIAQSRTSPTFVNARFVFYRADNGRSFVYDMRTKKETESTIEAIYDVWPHGA